jgi:peptidoglycan/LPS O-acetylase OafA/YrhL
VLSGFLITGTLIDSKTSKNYFSVFYIRRALRIFPLYYGLLAVSWLTVIYITPGDRPLLTGQDSMLWNWLYASNIGMAMKGDWLASPTWVGLGHFWSLAVEEQFYLIWPLIVFVVPVKMLRRLCIILVLASPLVFWLLPFWLGNVGTYVSTLSRLGVLAAGSWLAIAWRTAGGWEFIQPKLVPVAIGTGIVLLLERSFLPILSGLEPTLVLILGSACVGLAAGGGGGKVLQAFFESRVLRWLGKYSYAIYVYHHALKPVWIAYLWKQGIVPILGTGWPATLCYTAAATAASLGLAWLSWVCFEGPILSLKSRFGYRYPPPRVQ